MRASSSVQPNMTGTSSGHPSNPGVMTSSSTTGYQTRFAGVWTCPSGGKIPLLASDAARTGSGSIARIPSTVAQLRADFIRWVAACARPYEGESTTA